MISVCNLTEGKFSCPIFIRGLQTKSFVIANGRKLHHKAPRNNQRRSGNGESTLRFSFNLPRTYYIKLNGNRLYPVDDAEVGISLTNALFSSICLNSS